MILVRIVLILMFVSCAAPQKVEQDSILHITELTPDKDSHLTTQNLVHLTKVFDLNPFLYSKIIHVKSRVQAVSYPVITLETRFADNPPKLLSALLHQQFHWWLRQNPEKVLAITKTLTKQYPRLKNPVLLIVCYLQHRSLIIFLGKKTADQINYDYINKDKINARYNYLVKTNSSYFKRLIQDNALMPPGLD